MKKNSFDMIKEKIKLIFKTKTIFYVFTFLTLFLFFVCNYIYSTFTNVTIEQLVFSLFTSEGTDVSVIIAGFIYCFSNIAIVFLIIFNLKYFVGLFYHRKTTLNIFFGKNSFNFSLFPLSIKTLNILSVLVFLISFSWIFIDIGLFDYWFSKNTTRIFENYYCDPHTVEIEEPEKKKNLIFIYVESLESTFVSSENGGAFNKSVVPNLEKLALENINFSNNNRIGGAYMVNGTNWTIAGIVASSAGVPLKTSGDENDFSGDFLPGVYTIGDVLKEHGYKNYFLLGSYGPFGGKQDYFENHGNYSVFDHGYATRHGYLPKNYKVFWGYEDSKLFKIAKKNLKEISKKNKPFNYTILTVNTHFIDGYVEKDCETPFNYKYLNAYYCVDGLIGDFISWVKKQDFYNDTSIVIIGDHLTMQGNLKDVMDSKNYDRYIYNVYINSEINSDNIKNKKFTTFDFYPTTLASLGFKIKGERLGLGTNLFSSKKTLLEENGFDYFNNELKKKSKYYNKHILNK